MTICPEKGVGFGDRKTEFNRSCNALISFFGDTDSCRERGWFDKSPISRKRDSTTFSKFWQSIAEPVSASIRQKSSQNEDDATPADTSM
jgi:hypothetical protein